MENFSDISEPQVPLNEFIDLFAPLAELEVLKFLSIFSCWIYKRLQLRRNLSANFRYNFGFKTTGQNYIPQINFHHLYLASQCLI